MGKSEKTPRPEHPRPQFERFEWMNLNGEWSFEFDPGRSGLERGYGKSTGFKRKILVPFCPESDISYVGHKDFIDEIWYQRNVSIPRKWAGMRIMIHFGAVDYYSEIYIDGAFVGRHSGGSSSFEFDLTPHLRPEATHSLVVRACDDTRHGRQPLGKQCFAFKSFACHYTRTTGIWQTVWLEAMPMSSLKSCAIVPDLDGSRFVFTPLFRGMRSGLSLRARIFDSKRLVAEKVVPAADGIPFDCEIRSPKTWSPENPFLYGIEFDVLDGKSPLDRVRSYAGMRKIHIEGDRILLNDSPIYLRFVLDQGFYPDGIWTAPSDAALKNDIVLSMKAGFNGARLHQKVFEERFHYWADRMGYLTWAEFPSWGSDPNDPLAARNIITEWAECVSRDRNHPSIIAWTPLNETGTVSDPRQHNRLHQDLYNLTKAIDPTRPVNDASGYVHVKTDLWTVHNYEQDPKKLEAQLSPGKDAEVWRNHPDRECRYEGQPYLVDEFGGIKWIKGRKFADNSWGYGECPSTPADFISRLEGQVDAILSHPHISGYCYTQLTDVEQEQNGIYCYDRSAKFDMDTIRTIFSKSPKRRK
jgi:beta-galactosidase/beta-glucuronidase